MASFLSVPPAVEAAVAIHKRLAERNVGAAVPITLRIGIAAGKPVTDRGDLFAAAVQLAARLCSSASAGEIVVSVSVRELCAGTPVHFKDLGVLDLKGFSEPMPAFEVTWR
jgi:class 3 adenylate cyclase